jgi:hypothetical protein
MLFLVAAGLAAYVFLTHRREGVEVRGGAGTSRYEPVDPAGVTSVELIRSNSVLRVELTNAAWRMRIPVDYPVRRRAWNGCLGWWANGFRPAS